MMELVIKECKPPEFSRLFELRDMACKIVEEEEEERRRRRGTASLNFTRPYKKLRSAEDVERHHGWVESVTRMCGTFTLAFGEKELVFTDVNAHSNRFLLPATVKEVLLREMRAWEKGRTTKEGLPVRVFDKMGRMHEVMLADWASNHWLVLKGKNYRTFVKENRLQQKLQEKKGQHLKLRIGIWLFRHKEDDRLCFALVEFE